jgi:hypothetical protein
MQSLTRTESLTEDVILGDYAIFDANSAMMISQNNPSKSKQLNNRWSKNTTVSHVDSANVLTRENQKIRTKNGQEQRENVEYERSKCVNVCVTQYF